jgi:hypothetical protein
MRGRRTNKTTEKASRRVCYKFELQIAFISSHRSGFQPSAKGRKEKKPKEETTTSSVFS